MEVCFTVHGEPKGKGRPRFNRTTGHAITPMDTVNYESLVHLEYMRQCGDRRFPDDAMLEMRVKAYYAIPKSKSKKMKTLMREGAVRPTKKPDQDNIIKIVADALNGVAYRDDVQIVDCLCRKFYSDVPRVEVRILEASRMENEY